MTSKLDPRIDDLYKLPLDEFTKARNDLARTLPNKEKTVVASLAKPSIAMWAVNQLYWQDPSTYKALVDASEKLRAAHRGALNGRKVDTRAPDELHRTTLEKAFAKTIAAAEKKGTALTDPVRDAVRRTLATLPTDEPPGRLTREPPPVGFSLLTGIKPRQIDAHEKTKKASASSAPTRQDVKRQKAEEAQRRAAEVKARKEEEKARKEREKREREIAKAEQALRDAQRRLAELKS